MFFVYIAIHLVDRPVCILLCLIICFILLAMPLIARPALLKDAHHSCPIICACLPATSLIYLIDLLMA